MAGVAARQFYAGNGIANTIPLWPNTKRPIAGTWQSTSPDRQWRTAPLDANIGITHDGRLINLECDNRVVPATFDHVMAGLRGLGIAEPPIVRSASGVGRHVYLRCADAPGDVAYRKLSSEVGAGELRVGAGAMSVLPESVVGDNTYALICGDWRCIPVVEWRDLLWLLPLQRAITQNETLPVRLNFRPITPGIESLFDAVAKAGRGEPVGKYPSRSEAEAAIAAALVLNGWTFDDIRHEFERRNCGHYHDTKRYRQRYLANTYANALAVIMSSPVRQSLAADSHSAESAAWPGRTGNSDRATYLALLSECYRAGGIEASVSIREVSEHAAINPATAYRSLRRLWANDLIERVRGSSESGELAEVWKLAHGEYATGVTVKEAVAFSTPQAEGTRRAELTPVAFSTPPELASRAALGPSAVAVYRHLDLMQGRSIVALSRATGRARSTVRAALDRLQSYKLAALTRDGWIAGTNDLETVADGLGCEALATARRMRHAEQRAWYREWQRLLRERPEASGS